MARACSCCCSESQTAPYFEKLLWSQACLPLLPLIPSAYLEILYSIYTDAAGRGQESGQALLIYVGLSSMNVKPVHSTTQLPFINALLFLHELLPPLRAICSLDASPPPSLLVRHMMGLSTKLWSILVEHEHCKLLLNLSRLTQQMVDQAHVLEWALSFCEQVASV